MSAIKLSTPSSGSISLSPANTASNLTITVPAVTGTMLTNKTAGTVLQVVNATYGTSVSRSSNTYGDTGLTASITPSSSTSKILVMVAHNGCRKDTSNTTLAVQLVRNSTVISGIEGNGGRTGDTTTNQFGGIAITYLDSPSTTSSTTYKTQYLSTNNSGTVYINDNFDPSSPAVSSITLMEIAA